MDRRNFLRTLIGGVAAGAAVRTFPFRVYSFPSAPVRDVAAIRRALEILRNEDAMRASMVEAYREGRVHWAGLYGITYHNDVPPIGPWLNLNRSSVPIIKATDA